MPPPDPSAPPSSDREDREPTPHLVLFGFPATPVRMRVRTRSTGKRALRAGISATGTLFMAPLAFVVPPHAPWGLAVLLGGGILTWRGWRTRAVVEEFEASCPRCGHALHLPRGSRAEGGRALPCDGCGMTPILRLAAG
jgi:hypothetical protein